MSLRPCLQVPVSIFYLLSPRLRCEGGLLSSYARAHPGVRLHISKPACRSSNQMGGMPHAGWRD